MWGGIFLFKYGNIKPKDNAMTKELTVRIGIPHFYKETDNTKYGSTRKGNRLNRQMAMAKAIP